MPKDIERRLMIVEGQMRGLRRMAGEGAPCLELLTQLASVRAGLNAITAKVVARHLRHCVIEGVGPSASPGLTLDERLDEFDDLLGRMMK